MNGRVGPLGPPVGAVITAALLAGRGEEGRTDAYALLAQYVPIRMAIVHTLRLCHLLCLDYYGGDLIVTPLEPHPDPVLRGLIDLSDAVGRKDVEAVKALLDAPDAPLGNYLDEAQATLRRVLDSPPTPFPTLHVPDYPPMEGPTP